MCCRYQVGNTCYSASLSRPVLRLRTSSMDLASAQLHAHRRRHKNLGWATQALGGATAEKTCLHFSECRNPCWARHSNACIANWIRTVSVVPDGITTTPRWGRHMLCWLSAAWRSRPRKILCTSDVITRDARAHEHHDLKSWLLCELTTTFPIQPAYRSSTDRAPSMYATQVCIYATTLP